VRELAQAMPSITANEVVMVTDEGKLYRNEVIKSSVVYTNKDELKRVDHFFNDVLGRKSASGNPKCPTLQKLVLSCLCLTHRNADVERSLSVNKKTLTSERTVLSEKALNALGLTRYAVAQYGGNITKTMIEYVAEFHQKYLKRLDEEKQETDLL